MKKRIKGIYESVKNFFRIGYSVTRSNSKAGSKKVTLNSVELDNKGKIKNTPVKVPLKVQDLFEHYINNCHDNLEKYEDRMDLYADMDMLYLNNTPIARAVNLIADEVVQADSNNRILTVEAKKKQRKFIYDFIDRTGLEELLRPTAHNIVLYGDAGWIPEIIEKEGITKITNIDLYDLKERFEFTPYQVKQELKNKGSALSILRNQDVLNDLIDITENKSEDVSAYFQSHLFGFQVGDFLLPPWQFIHFRNTTSKGPFKPFGQPHFIHALSPYRQLEVAMSLQVAQRGAKMPVENIEINLPASMSPTSKLDKVAEFIEQYENSGINNNVLKEDIGVGERIYTIKDLVEMKMISPDIRLDHLDDIDLLRDDMIIATGLPRNFLDPNSGSFGNSGVSLIQQFKPFARTVYHIQSILLKSITQLVKLHMVMSGEFALADIDFQLSMPFPESQTNRDIISSQNDLLRLANDIIDSLGEKVTGERDAVIPVDLIKQIYSQILPYDSDKIEKWIDDIVKSRAAKDGDGEDGKNKNKKWESVTKKYTERELREVIDDTIYEGKREVLREGKMQNKHFYSSVLGNPDFDIKNIIEFKKRRMKRLKEKEQAEQAA